MTFNLRATARLPPNVEQEFLAGAWETALTSIPNLGATTAAKLAAAGIENTYSLCGQFLMLKTEGDTSQTRCNAFCAFLDEAGVSRGLLSVLTYTVAKKLNRSFPGFLCVRAGVGWGRQALLAQCGRLYSSRLSLHTHTHTHTNPTQH